MLRASQVIRALRASQATKVLRDSQVIRALRVSQATKVRKARQATRESLDSKGRTEQAIPVQQAI